MTKSNKIRLNRIIKKYSKKKKKHIHHKHEAYKIQSGGAEQHPEKANYKVTFEFDRIKDSKEGIWGEPKMTMICQKFDTELNTIIKESVAGMTKYGQNEVDLAITSSIGAVSMIGTTVLGIGTAGLGLGLLGAGIGVYGAITYNNDKKKKIETLKNGLENFEWCKKYDSNKNMVDAKGFHELYLETEGINAGKEKVEAISGNSDYVKIINYPGLLKEIDKIDNSYITDFSLQPLSTKWYFPTCYDYNQKTDSCDTKGGNKNGDACDEALIIPHGLINLTKITDNSYGHQIPKKIVWRPKKESKGGPSDTQMTLEKAAQKQVNAYIQERGKKCNQQWKQYEIDRINNINDCALVKGKYNPTIDIADFIKKSQLKAKAIKDKKEQIKNGLSGITKKEAAAASADAASADAASGANTSKKEEKEKEEKKISPQEQKLNEEEMNKMVKTCEEIDLMIISILTATNIMDNSKVENKDFIDSFIANYFNIDNNKKENLNEFEIKIELSDSLSINSKNINTLFFKQNWENTNKKGWVIDWNKEHILEILRLNELIETQNMKIKGLSEEDTIKYNTDNPNFQFEILNMVTKRDNLQTSFSYMNENVIKKINNNLITKIVHENPGGSIVSIYGDITNSGELDKPSILPTNNDLIVPNKEIDKHLFITSLQEIVKKGRGDRFFNPKEKKGNLIITCIKSPINIDLDDIIEQTKEKLTTIRNDYIEESLLKSNNDSEKEVSKYLGKYTWYKQYYNSPKKDINHGFNTLYSHLLHKLLEPNNIVFEDETKNRENNYNLFKKSFPKQVNSILNSQNKNEIMSDYSKKYSDDATYDFVGYTYINEYVENTEKKKLPEIPKDIVRISLSKLASMNDSTSQEVIDAILFEEYYSKKQHNMITNAKLLLNSEGINNPSLIQTAKKVLFLTLQDHNEYLKWRNSIDNSCSMTMSENDIRKQWEEWKDSLTLQPKKLPTDEELDESGSFIGSAKLFYNKVKTKAKSSIAKLVDTVTSVKAEPIMELNPDFSFKEFVKDTLSNLNNLNTKKPKKLIHEYIFKSILQHIFPDMITKNMTDPNAPTFDLNLRAYTQTLVDEKAKKKSTAANANAAKAPKDKPTGTISSDEIIKMAEFEKATIEVNKANIGTDTAQARFKIMKKLKKRMFENLYTKYKVYVSKKDDQKWKQKIWIYFISDEYKNDKSDTSIDPSTDQFTVNIKNYIKLKDIILINLVHKYLFEAIDFIIDKFKLIDGQCFIIQNYINHFNYPNINKPNNFVTLCNKVSEHINTIDCSHLYPSDKKKQKEGGYASKSIKKELKIGQTDVLAKEEKNIIKYMRILYELKRYWSDYNLNKIEDMAITKLFQDTQYKQSFITFLWAQRDINSNKLGFSGVGLFNKLEWHIPNDINLTGIRRIDLIYKENIINLKQFYKGKSQKSTTATYSKIFNDIHCKELIDHMTIFNYIFTDAMTGVDTGKLESLRKKCIDIINKNPMYSVNYLSILKSPKIDINMFNAKVMEEEVTAIKKAVLVDISADTVSDKLDVDGSFEELKEEEEMSGGGMKYIPMELI